MPKLELPRCIHMENGSVHRLAAFVKSVGGTRAFVVMDSFLTRTPLYEKVKHILQEGDVESVFFSDYLGEPTTDHVRAALDVLKRFRADCVIGIGGGSALDLAKSVSLLARHAELDWSDISEQPFLDRLPLLAVPTTAGTGSEATKVMVITNVETSVKMNPAHPRLIPDAAILDPELTLSLPRTFTVYTGLDALAHAIEAYVSSLASMMTDLFALEAIRIAGRALPRLHENGSDLEARQNMILASCYAGIAFSNASTNLTHATGRPLGARFHIPHGLSIALLLPFVIRFGLAAAERRYAEIAVALGADPSSDRKKLAESTLTTIEGWNEQFGIWSDGKTYVDAHQLREAIPTLVEDAISGNGITTNLKIPTKQDVADIYEALAQKLS